jgi:hypothetical protein
MQQKDDEYLEDFGLSVSLEMLKIPGNVAHFRYAFPDGIT